MLRIALAQINTTVGDFQGNLDKILDFTARARHSSADLVVFPELAITGYPPEDLLLREDFYVRNMRTLKELCQKTGDEIIITGFIERDKNKQYNSLVVIHKGHIAGIYRKNHLPNYGVFDEKRYFHAGKEPLLLAVRGFLINLTICEDIWVKGAVEGIAKRFSVDAVINISSSPYHKDKLRERMELISERALSGHAPVIYVNLTGGQDELVFDGGSMVADAAGKIVRFGRQFNEDLIFFDLEKSKKEKKGRSRNIISIGLKEGKGENPLQPSNAVGPLEGVGEIFSALVLGTRDYVLKNGFKKVVLGLSGGIDSALVAVLAVEALGKDNVIAVTMPSRFSSKETYSDALLLAGNLGVECKIISIEEVYKASLETFKKEFEGRPVDITEENLQARIRGNFLMALSNKNGWLVLTTGNKSELSCGYSTIYGDMAGGFSVIKDVYKTVVYDLARFVNRKDMVIPRSIIDRPPTAELRPDQKDQDCLPPYEILDGILELYIEKDLSPDSIVERGFDRPTVSRVVRMVDVNEYKRRQSACGVKITPRAFGRDRRMPITNKFA